jgi:hypothetical protein
MAFLIITPMLAFVVDMLNTDRREQVKSNTEQDVQAALDFIAQDLSQAIYIYDNRALNGSPRPNEDPVGPQLRPITNNGTPILVFWKRKQIRNAVSVETDLNKRTKPNACDKDTCNDTYTRSLVAYYQVTETDPNSIWCQPSGSVCPTRIARYEISEGIMKNPAGLTADDRYFNTTEANDGQQHNEAFNLNFDWSQPTKNVIDPAGVAKSKPQAQVLVNYIDHSPLSAAPPDDECEQALGKPTDTTGVTPTPLPEKTLKITDPAKINSFYACVDTARNIARVTIRGNSLRRIQTDATYDAKKAAYFPTASVQVQGLGARGK